VLQISPTAAVACLVDPWKPWLYSTFSLPRYVGKFSFGQAHGCSQPTANRATKIVGIAVFCTALNRCLAFVLVRSVALLLRVVMWEFAATAEVMFELYWRIARNILIYFSIP
jgi:hypothetical protein